MSEQDIRGVLFEAGYTIEVINDVLGNSNSNSLENVSDVGESLIEEAQIQNNICIPITMFGPKETEQMSITTSIICTRNDSM